MASIDVAVPCYQYGRYLGDCLTSILAQDVAALRVLVIDNASTDDSVEVAQEFARCDSRVEVIARPRNLGATASYNDGVDWAAADYFLLLDADDVLAPGSLDRATRFLDAHPGVSMTYGAELRTSFAPGALPVFDPPAATEDWTIEHGDDFIRRLCRSAVNHVGATTVVRRTAAQKVVGHYRAELPYTDDLELWMRLALEGDVASTATIQAARRLHPGQDTNNYMDFLVRDVIERAKAFDCFFAPERAALPDARELHATARRRLADQSYWSGISHMLRGHRAAGKALLAHAIRERPNALLLPPLGHILTMKRPVGRLGEIAAEAFRQARQKAAR